MIIWKKISVFCLCLAVVFSLAGCDLARIKSESSKPLDVMDSGDFEDVLKDLDYTVSSSGSDMISTKSLDVIDAGDFTDVLEDMGYEAEIYDAEDNLSEGQVEMVFVYDEEDEHLAVLARYENEEDTVIEFNDMYHVLMDTVESEDFDGSYSMTQGRNFQKLIVNGEFSYSTGDFREGVTYMVVFQIEDTLVLAMAYDNGKSDVKEVDKIVKELGYFDSAEENAEFFSEGLEESLYAYDDDNNFYVSFFEYSDEEDAVDAFDNVTDDLKDAEDDENFDGSYKKTTGKNYQKCVINGEFTDAVSIFYEGDTYIVVFRVEETLIVVMAYDNGKSDIKEVDKIVEELGY